MEYFTAAHICSHCGMRMDCILCSVYIHHRDSRGYMYDSPYKLSIALKCLHKRIETFRRISLITSIMIAYNAQSRLPRKPDGQTRYERAQVQSALSIGPGLLHHVKACHGASCHFPVMCFQRVWLSRLSISDRHGSPPP